MPDRHDDKMDLGTFTRADLEALATAGAIEIVQPGTPEAEAFDQRMIDELPAYNAALLAREGPDALTSDRALRQAALAAEQDPECIGYAFAAWCSARDWERPELAAWLGVTLDQLAALAIEHRADPGYPLDAGVPQHDLAERYGADPERLGEVLG